MRLFGLFLFVFVLTGCQKEKLKSPEAFFIKTSAVSVNTVASQGTNSNKITDLWLYVDGNFKGAYPLGSTLPINSASGHAKINVYGGIKNNGISATRQPYEFYEPIELDTSVSNGTTVERSFSFNYKPAAKFPFIESFEGGAQGINMAYSIDSDINFTIVNGSQSFEGACMYFALDEVNQIAKFESTTLFSIPLFGAPVFAEINYKCDQPFEVGVYCGSSYKRASYVNGSEVWNKIYVQLSTAASIDPNSSKQGFYIKAVRDPAIANPQFYIDNIKIISY